jgi:hypothetical protein
VYISEESFTVHDELKQEVNTSTYESERTLSEFTQHTDLGSSAVVLV